MNYEEIQRYQAERELVLEQITSGSPYNNDHIVWCLSLVDSEPDDLIRIYAKLWLENNCKAIAGRLVK